MRQFPDATETVDEPCDVFVDPLCERPLNVGSAEKWKWGKSCHMYSYNLDALHAMAEKIGLKRDWFIGLPLFPHYDISAAMRRKAIAAGAIEMSREHPVYFRRRRSKVDATIL